MQETSDNQFYPLADSIWFAPTTEPVDGAKFHERAAC